MYLKNKEKILKTNFYNSSNIKESIKIKNNNFYIYDYVIYINIYLWDWINVQKFMVIIIANDESAKIDAHHTVRTLWTTSLILFCIFLLFILLFIFFNVVFGLFSSLEELYSSSPLLWHVMDIVPGHGMHKRPRGIIYINWARARSRIYLFSFSIYISSSRINLRAIFSMANFNSHINAIVLCLCFSLFCIYIYIIQVIFLYILVLLFPHIEIQNTLHIPWGCKQRE